MDLELDKIKQQIKELEQRQQALEEERKQLKQRIKDIEKELDEIEPAYSTKGKLKRFKWKLEEALRIEADSKNPLVIFASTKRPPLSVKPQIVTRVTQKRIYYRAKGQREEFYADKQTGECYEGVIDTEKTLEAWSEYEKSIQAAKASN